MQLAATRKVGVVGLVQHVLGAAATWWLGHFWWLVGAAVLTFGAFHHIMHSCVRFGRLYKTEPAFKAKVDAFERGARVGTRK